MDLAVPAPVLLRTGDDIVLSVSYYAGVSDGPCYLLGHGFTGSSTNEHFQRVAERLHSRGASVLGLTFRGHGKSGGTSTVGVNEVEDVTTGLEFLRRTRPGVPVVTLGFSMGASVFVRHAGLAAPERRATCWWR